MEASELVDRSISFRTGLSSRDLMMGAKLLTEDQLSKIQRTLETAKNTPVVYHQESLDIESLLKVYNDFVDDCRDKEKKDGIKRQPIAILDYVGLASFEGSGIRTYGINEFYAKLKQSANKTGGHWIVLAQLDKSARSKEIPDLNDLADSQSIERNSDNILLLHRPEHLNKSMMQNPNDGYNEISSKNKMLLRVAKCRLFGVRDMIMACDMSKYRFWSLDHPAFNYPYWKMYEDERFWRHHFGYEEEGDFKLL
jgi:replicative DNA helicase